MLTVRDPELARRAEVLRNHGARISEEARHSAPKPYEMPEFDETGYNYRMTDIQAAVGCTQLRKLDTFIEERSQLADAYDEALGRLQWLSLPLRPASSRHALQSYVLRVGADAPISRDEMLARLHESGVGARPGTHSVVGLSVYRKRFGSNPAEFPGASALERGTLAIPLHNHMTLNDVARVSGLIAGFGP